MEMTNSLQRLVREQEARQREAQETEEALHEPLESMSPSRRALHDLFEGAKKEKLKVTIKLDCQA